MAKVVRPLPLDTRSAIEIDYTRPFKLVRLDFETEKLCMSTGPAVTLSNLLTYSEDLSQGAVWPRTHMAVPVVPGYQVPDSPLVLNKLAANATNNASHYLDYRVLGTFADNERVSCAMYVKKAEQDFIRMNFVVKNGSGPTLGYQFSTKTMVTQSQGTGNTEVQFYVEDLGDDLVRLVMTNISMTTGATVPRFRPFMQLTNPNTSWAGNSVDGTYVGGCQVWRGSERYPYVKSGATPYGTEVYNAGLVDVGDMTWGPDGDQSGEIELFNENNSATALVLANGVAETPCTVSDVYLKADGNPTVPIITSIGVLTDSDITPTSTIVTMTTAKAGVEFQPNRFVTPAEGFNWLPHDGAQVIWGNETYIFERD